MAKKPQAEAPPKTSPLPQSEQSQMPVPAQPQLPADWEKRMQDEAKAAQAAEPSQGRFISLRGGVMTFQGNALPNNRLSAIVLDSVIEHQLYEGQFDANQAASPVCYGFGRSTHDMKPHPASEKKQSEHCSSCSKFQWGSDPRGGRGKACREVRRLAVIDGGLVEKGAAAIRAAEVVFMKLPVTSVRNWAAYVSQLSNVARRPPWGVVTGIAPQPDQKSVFVVKFSLDAQLDQEIITAVAAKRQALGDAGIMFPYKAGGDAKPADPAAAQQQAARRESAKY